MKIIQNCEDNKSLHNSIKQFNFNHSSLDHIIIPEIQWLTKILERRGYKQIICLHTMCDEHRKNIQLLVNSLFTVNLKFMFQMFLKAKLIAHSLV